MDLKILFLQSMFLKPLRSRSSSFSMKTLTDSNTLTLVSVIDSKDHDRFTLQKNLDHISFKTVLCSFCLLEDVS